MKRQLIILFSISFLFACKKDAEVGDIFSDLKFSQSEIPADGQSTVVVSVVLSDKSNSDRRSVIFSTTSGSFIASGTNKYTAKAEFEDGLIVAKATLRSTTQPGTIKVSVKPEFDSPLKEFVLLDSIISKPSIPVSIKLEPSSFGIASNFLNEVQITGTLKNSAGKFVSKGNNVLFENTLSNGVNANGNFRSLQTTTSDSSKVGGFYSANMHPIGTIIKIKGTLLDANNTKTSITDSIYLTINQ